MPTRPDSHKIADTAVSAVTNLCHEAGWTCDVVKSDYGEDLFVQTTLGSKLDHCKLWIQVKGSKKINTDNKKKILCIRIKADQSLRWVRSADLVIVVLWDVSKKVGYWTLPAGCLHEWKLLFGKTKTVKLSFDKRDKFNQDSLNKIGWLARTHHYELLLNRSVMDDASNFDDKNHESQTPLLLLDFLKKIGVITKNGISKDLRKRYKKFLIIFKKDGINKKKDLSAMASIMAIMEIFSDIAPGVGLHSTIIAEAGRMVDEILSEPKPAK